ncbi:MAG: carboxypeptidase regulatory-like domain-containing protein [Cyanobacteria bacterium HKST-UBA06]|nr:carboxypeptidase regulatory-like domain-containing protein [Cyanobacteria bacterium HKST-UBA06]
MALVAVFASVLVGLVYAPAMPVARAETLKGRVDYYGEHEGSKAQGPQQNGFLGRVTDSRTGKGLGGATVSVPSKGFKTQTDGSGAYRIREGVLDTQKPMILSVEKDGYAPFSITIRQSQSPPMQLKLTQLASGIVLDSQLRHLGDGSYAPASSGAGKMRLPAQGIALQIPFRLNGHPVSDKPTLVIGSIIGLDTMMAHTVEGNPMGVSAGPLLVMVNGRQVAAIQVNGDGQRIQVPASALNPSGQNMLTVQTGYQVKGYTAWGEQQLDYDDMELMHLTLYP